MRHVHIEWPWWADAFWAAVGAIYTVNTFIVIPRLIRRRPK